MDRRDLIAALAGSAALSACRAIALVPDARAGLYDCEGCEGARERPAAAMPATARIDREGEPGERLEVTGRVIGLDGKPAPGVVVYAYHTNAAGLYAGGTPETEWSRRHGRLRGWVKTGADGLYRFETIKPAPYPDMSLPAHVHLTVLEPGRQTYWIDDVVFAEDALVDARYRAARENRGGNGIVRLRRTAEGRLVATRDIVLERHPA